MPISKIKSSSITADAASTNLNIDANTLFLDATNNRVGVGTTSPDVKLQVTDTIDVGIAMSNSSSVTTGNRGSLAMFNSANSTVGLIRFGAVTDNVGTDIQFYSRPAGGALSQTMTLTSVGNLGIGTTNPQFKFHVRGADATSLFVVGNTTEDTRLEVSTYQDDRIVLRANDSSNIARSIAFETGLTERMRIDSSGEVLIGGTAQGRETNLSVDGTYQDPTGVWAQVGIYSTDTQAANKGGTIGFGGQDGSLAKQQFAAIKGAKENSTSANYAGYMAFYTRPAGDVTAERMRITSAGNVGIGTSSPAGKLDIYDNRADRMAFFYNASTNAAASGLFIESLAANGSTKAAWQTGYALTLSNGNYLSSGIVSKLVLNTANGGYNNGAIIHVEGAGGYTLGQLVFSTGWDNSGNATERMRINASGKVGIGNTAPTGNLHIGNGSTVADQDLYVQSDSANRPRLRLWGGTTNKLELSVGGTADINVVNELPLVFSTNNTERARMPSDGGLFVGSTSIAGSVGNYATVLGGVFKSFSGTTAATASGTYVTLFTSSSGTITSYLVTVWISADDVNNYQANVIVNTQAGTSTKVSVIVPGSLLQFQMSGYSLQARQNSGGTSTISWSAIRIAA